MGVTYGSIQIRRIPGTIDAVDLLFGHVSDGGHLGCFRPLPVTPPPIFDPLIVVLNASKELRGELLLQTTMVIVGVVRHFDIPPTIRN